MVGDRRFGTSNLEEEEKKEEMQLRLGSGGGSRCGWMLAAQRKQCSLSDRCYL